MRLDQFFHISIKLIRDNQIPDPAIWDVSLIQIQQNSIIFQSENFCQLSASIISHLQFLCKKYTQRLYMKNSQYKTCMSKRQAYQNSNSYNLLTRIQTFNKRILNFFVFVAEILSELHSIISQHNHYLHFSVARSISVPDVLPEV